MVTTPLITDTISSLVSKLSLCMLLLSCSLLFYRNNDRRILIPLHYRKICSLSLILLTCLISFFGTLEFNTIMGNFIENYKDYDNMLYSYDMLVRSRTVYIIVSSIYILTALFIVFLMLYYDYKKK